MQVRDHNGTKFSSMEEMCRFYNICSNTVRKRLKSGWPLKRALTEIAQDQSYKLRIGYREINKSGVMYEVVNVNDNNTVTIQFSDGMRIIRKRKMKNGKPFGHPLFARNGNGIIHDKKIYAGFESKTVSFVHKNNVYYECYCIKCGYKGILNPQEMVLHRNNECRRKPHVN